MTWRDRKFEKKKRKKKALNVTNMSEYLQNRGRKLPGLPDSSPPPPLLLQWHHYSQFHPCSLFQATVSVCTHARLCVWVSVWQREKQSRSLCNSVCEGTNTHLYDNFLFTMSKDSNTDTIHFPFINWCGNVGPAAVTSEVFQGWEVAEFVLRVGRESYKYKVDDFGSHASIIVYLPETRGLASMNI